MELPGAKNPTRFDTQGSTVRSFTDQMSPMRSWRLCEAAQQAPLPQMYAVYTRDAEKKEWFARTWEVHSQLPVFVLFCMDFRA